MSRQGTTPNQEIAKDENVYEKNLSLIVCNFLYQSFMTDRFCGLSYFFRRFFRKDKTRESENEERANVYDTDY